MGHVKHEQEQYLNCIENSEKVTWHVNELLPDDYPLSYEKTYMPNKVSRVSELELESDVDKLLFSQIWGASYFNLFAFVEEYITLFALNLATESTFKESLKFRAYVRFSEEEIKHQILFRKFVDKFNSSFHGPCEFLANSQQVASTILSNSKLCVLLLTYHLEVVTQDHYQSCIKNSENVDSKFKEILKSHWVEEVQHAKIDLLKLQDEYSIRGEEELLVSIDEYFYILEAFVSILQEQVRMNYESLLKYSKNSGKYKSEEFRKMYMKKQTSAFVTCFILMGLDNPIFIKNISGLSKRGIEKIQEKAHSFRARFE